MEDSKSIYGSLALVHNEIFREITDYAILVLDINGDILNWNKGAEKIKGYTSEEIQGKNFSAFYTKEDRDLGIPAILLKQASLLGRAEHQGWRVRKDGSKFWGLVSITALHNKDKELIGYTKITKDLTEEYKKGIALHEGYEKMLLFIKHAPSAIAMFDRDMKYIAASEQWLHDYNLTGRDIIGRSHYDVFPEIGEEWKRIHRECMQGAINKCDEAEFMRSDGKFQWLSWDVRPWYEDENIVGGIIMLTTDITERKQTEANMRKYAELEARNREMEQFAFVASHDMQEPLRVISGFASLLRKRYMGKLDEDADTYLEYIFQSSKRVSELIKGLLHYSRLGKASEAGTVDCNRVLKDVLDDLREGIKGKNARVMVKSLPVIEGYRVELYALFQNLISNAIKFTRAGYQPQVDVSCEKQINTWLFKVSDNGIGIAPEDAEKVFLIFRRLNNREDYEGNGIGLANCKKIVELHGGKIWVEANTTGGSTFCFTIPCLSLDFA